MFISNLDAIHKLAKSNEESSIFHFFTDLVNFTLARAQPSSFLSSAVSFSENTLLVQGSIFDLTAYSRFYLVSIGKAAQSMALWFLDHFPHTFSKIIISSPSTQNSSFSSLSSSLEFFHGGHPIPNNQSFAAANSVCSLLHSLEPNDFCIFLISGGGSSLFDYPDHQLSFLDYQQLISTVLKSGATIHEFNTLRKHFSKVKGGKLSLLSSATLLSLIISDVVGNEGSVIASGPTFPDFSSWKDCEDIFQKYDLYSKLPSIFSDILFQGLQGKVADSPSSSNLFSKTYNFIIGDNTKVLSLLQKKISTHYPCNLVDSSLTGESKDVGIRCFQETLERLKDLNSSFLCLLYGGETTVTLSSFSGKGGRVQELALSFLISSFPSTNVYICAFGTDGIDGNSPAAGAIAGPFCFRGKTIEEAQVALANHDSSCFFEDVGSTLLTGYTGTNVMDIVIILAKKND